MVEIGRGSCAPAAPAHSTLRALSQAQIKAAQAAHVYIHEALFPPNVKLSTKASGS